MSVTVHYCTEIALKNIFLFRFLPIDEEKLRVIINMAANRARMGVNTAGHIYAMRSAASGLTPATSMSEIFSGLTQVCWNYVHMK